MQTPTGDYVMHERVHNFMPCTMQHQIGHACVRQGISSPLVESVRDSLAVAAAAAATADIIPVAHSKSLVSQSDVSKQFISLLRGQGRQASLAMTARPATNLSIFQWGGCAHAFQYSSDAIKSKPYSYACTHACYDTASL